MTADDGAAGESEHLRGRVDGSRAKLWLLLEADRRLLTGLLLAVVFGTLAGVGSLYPPAEAAVRSSDSVDTLFQALVTATITGVTLVLTLNQLVLSQELGAVGDQRERMDEAMTFRRDAAELVEAPVSPARPAQFLRALVEVSGACAERLRESVSGSGDPERGGEVRAFADSLAESAADVSEALDGARFGDFEVLSAALDFDYSRRTFEARRLRERHGDGLDDAGAAALDRLIELLRLFGPAREHFKTLYFQWELIDLSRRILALSIPSLLVAGSMIAFFDAATYGATVAGTGTLVFVVAAATTVAVAPFMLLLAYVVRIATVAKRTLSIGPFVLRETDDVAEVEWGR